MKNITIQFQLGDGNSRPEDASLTYEPLDTVDDISKVPLVGDYFTFHEEIGPTGTYQVISRLFDYSSTGIFANLVLKLVDVNEHQKLIKH